MEVACAFSIVIYLLFLAILININLLIPELEILFVLIALGCACIVLLIGIGFFMHARDRFMGILGKEEDFPSKTTAQRVVLTIWILAILFFSAAVYYGLYLVNIFYIFPSVGQSFRVIIIIILFGVIIICVILQFFLVILAKYTRRVVEEVLQ